MRRDLGPLNLISSSSVIGVGEGDDYEQFEVDWTKIDLLKQIDPYDIPPPPFPYNDRKPDVVTAYEEWFQLRTIDGLIKHLTDKAWEILKQYGAKKVGNSREFDRNTVYRKAASQGSVPAEIYVAEQLLFDTMCFRMRIDEGSYDQANKFLIDIMRLILKPQSYKQYEKHRRFSEEPNQQRHIERTAAHRTWQNEATNIRENNPHLLSKASVARIVKNNLKLSESIETIRKVI